MRILRSIDEYLDLRKEQNLGSSGFVPTMGALHPGHESLIQQSVMECDSTVVSIYVNPTQFNNPTDLQNYPDTLEKDIESLEKLNVDILFLPTYQQIYADEFRYSVTENRLSQELCGAHREGHFTGVLTIVMKLLNIVRADRAYFGEKDYQQYLLIKGMAEAFFLDTDIIACPTVRERDGLALSSRNQNLDALSRSKAPLMHQLLTSNSSDSEIEKKLVSAGFQVDYVHTREGRRFVAAILGEKNKAVRLIDNVTIRKGAQ